MSLSPPSPGPSSPSSPLTHPFHPPQRGGVTPGRGADGAGEAAACRQSYIYLSIYLSIRIYDMCMNIMHTYNLTFEVSALISFSPPPLPFRSPTPLTPRREEGLRLEEDLMGQEKRLLVDNVHEMQRIKTRTPQTFPETALFARYRP